MENTRYKQLSHKQRYIITVLTRPFSSRQKISTIPLFYIQKRVIVAPCGLTLIGPAVVADFYVALLAVVVSFSVGFSTLIMFVLSCVPSTDNSLFYFASDVEIWVRTPIVSLLLALDWFFYDFVLILSD